MSKIKKIWIAPFPTGTGKNSGMVSIAMRVDKDEDKFPLRLEKNTEFACLKQNNEVHYALSLLDDESLLLLNKAIADYFNKQ